MFQALGSWRRALKRGRADNLFVFFPCHLAAGNANHPGSQGNRRKREVGGHETNAYSLAEDPLHLAQGKREAEKVEKEVDKSGM